MISHFSRRIGFAVTGALLAVAPAARAEFPTLDVAIQRARAQAIVVAEAEGELGVARAQMVGARTSAFGNPYTDIQVDRPFSNLDTAGRQVQALSYTYFPVDIAGQRGKRIDEAARLLEWRKTGLVDARALATGDVVAAYGEYVVSAARVAESSAGETSAREELKYFQGRLEAKDTTLYEQSISEGEVARWVQARAEAELRVAAAHARFSQLTGEPDITTPPGNVSIAPPPLRKGWDDARLLRVIDRAPIISRLGAERTYWTASIERYGREKVPPVSFEVIAGRGSQGEARLGGGAVITFPITHRYQGEIARAESSLENATKRAQLFRGVVLARLRAARDAIRTVDKALKELDASGLPALERAVSTSIEGVRAGKIDLTRVLLARRDLATARARRLDLLEAVWRAYAELVVLSGELP